MIDFSLFTAKDGVVAMSDVITTLGTIIVGLVAWRQKQKDEQIKSRDETIEFLKSQIVYLQNHVRELNERT